MELPRFFHNIVTMLLFILTFDINTTGCKDGLCPDTFVRHKYYRNTCYHINTEQTATDPMGAQEYCGQFNSSLAEIYNKVQIDFITEHADTLFKSNMNADISLLVNLSSGTQDRFEWVESTQGEQTYLSKFGAKWKLKRGSQRAPFVCEYKTDTDASSNVALTDGTGFSNGRLEIYYNGRWRPVCSSNSDRMSYIGDICVTLGYCGSGRFLSSAEFLQRNEDLLTDSFRCIGNRCIVINETEDCSYDKQVGLSCYDQENPLLACGDKIRNNTRMPQENEICPKRFHISDIRIPRNAITVAVLSFLLLLNLVTMLLLVGKRQRKRTFKTCSTQTVTQNHVTFSPYLNRDIPTITLNGVREFPYLEKPISVESRSVQTSFENLLLISQSSGGDMTDSSYSNGDDEESFFTEKEFISCCIQTSIENLNVCCCKKHDEKDTKTDDFVTDVTNSNGSSEEKQFKSSSTQTRKLNSSKLPRNRSLERHVNWPTYEIIRIQRLSEETPGSNVSRHTNKRKTSMSGEKRQLLMPKEPWRYTYKVPYKDPDTLDRPSYDQQTIDGKPCAIHQ